jgi:deferrochelatase/peroxidase EfeB
MTARLDLADLQGDILRAHGNSYDRTSYLFVAVGDARRGRDWLSALIPSIATAAWSADRPATVLNVAFTYAGLAALGVPQRVLDTCSAEFRQGMAARAAQLGDTGPSAPERWDDRLGTGEAHVLLTLNARGEDALKASLPTVKEGIASAGLAVVHEEHARLLDGAREHFGFADGAAQPAVEGIN